jgi:diguanylate cyclase (GGDEF)-like protein/PAS domain S-box-containing protein
MNEQENRSALNGLTGASADALLAEQSGNEDAGADGPRVDMQGCYNALYKSNFYCIYVHDLDGRFLNANNAALNLLGYNEEELSRLSFASFLPEEQISAASRFIEYLKCSRAQERPIELRLRRKTGEYVWVETEASVIYLQGMPFAIQWVARDITSSKKIIDDLHALSIIDDLTGLYNRRGFLTLAERHIRLARRMKKEMLLLFADVDGLKAINDTLGHQEGDKALIDTSNILRNTFRETDVVARIGGDEFAVLAIDALHGTTQAVTKRLQENMRSYREKNGHKYSLSISTGITIHNARQLCSVEELLVSADKKMYRQKRNRQQRLPVFDPASRTGKILLAEAFSNI